MNGHGVTVWYQGGAWPCAASEADYAVFCAECGDAMNDHAEREADGEAS